MKLSNTANTLCAKGREDASNDVGPRQFRHRLTANGIESRCLQCGLLIGAAQDEWLLLSLELVHVCDAEIEP